MDDDCCDVPLITAPREARARPKRNKFLRANPCCSDDGCRSTDWSAHAPQGRLNTIETSERSGAINTVAEDEFVQIDVYVDSGATETVMSEATLSGVIDITEGPPMKR